MSCINTQYIYIFCFFDDNETNPGDDSFLPSSFLGWEYSVSRMRGWWFEKELGCWQQCVYMCIYIYTIVYIHIHIPGWWFGT